MAEQVTFTPENLPEFLRIVSRLARDVPSAVDDATRDAATLVIDKARTLAHRPLESLVASALAVGGSGDDVVIGATGRIGRRDTPAEVLMLGAEYGGRARSTTQQFPPFAGERGYFVGPAADGAEAAILALYGDAIDDASRTWRGD